MTMREICNPAGLIIATFVETITTDYFTSSAHTPVKPLGKEFVFKSFVVLSRKVALVL
jgi:hypothetical protein